MNLKQIEKLSPVKIEYTYLGCQSGVYKWQEHCIRIEKTLESRIKRLVLLHEIGHANCHKYNCRCMLNYDKQNVILSEYHAQQFCMKLIKNDKALVNIFVKEVKWVAEQSFFPHHSEAAKQIMRLKGWKKLNQVV